MGNRLVAGSGGLRESQPEKKNHDSSSTTLSAQEQALLLALLLGKGDLDEYQLKAWESKLLPQAQISPLSQDQE